LNYLIEDIARISFFLPVLFYVFSKSEKTEIKRVIFYFGLYILFHEIVFSLSKHRFPNFAYFFNLLYVPVEFGFVSYYFIKVIKNEFYKKVIKILSATFFLFWIIFSILAFKLTFDSILNSAESITILIFCILYYFEQIRSPQTYFIYTQQSFWVTGAFFIFTSGTFFIFLFRQSSIQVDGFRDQFAYIHALLFLLRNILFSIIMFINPEKKTYSDIPPTLV
jgi:hypothetical protein